MHRATWRQRSIREASDRDGRISHAGFARFEATPELARYWPVTAALGDRYVR
jgi:hypothetical protein